MNTQHFHVGILIAKTIKSKTDAFVVSSQKLWMWASGTGTLLMTMQLLSNNTKQKHSEDSTTLCRTVSRVPWHRGQPVLRPGGAQHDQEHLQGDQLQLYQMEIMAAKTFLYPLDNDDDLGWPLSVFQAFFNIDDQRSTEHMNWWQKVGFFNWSCKRFTGWTLNFKFLDCSLNIHLLRILSSRNFVDFIYFYCRTTWSQSGRRPLARGSTSPRSCGGGATFPTTASRGSSPPTVRTTTARTSPRPCASTWTRRSPTSATKWTPPSWVQNSFTLQLSASYSVCANTAISSFDCKFVKLFRVEANWGQHLYLQKRQ